MTKQSGEMNLSDHEAELMASNDHEAARILLRLKDVHEKCESLMGSFRDSIGLMTVQLFEIISASIDVKSRVKKNQEFESEFDRLRFYNQKHWQIYERYKSLRFIEEELRMRVQEFTRLTARPDYQRIKQEVNARANLILAESERNYHRMLVF